MIIRVLSVILLVILIGGIWYAWLAFPIISGYGAKNLCSAVYLQHRNPSEVIREDLGDFPLSIGTFTLNEKDSSVTGSVWGFAKSRAIYRKGLGCTLINDFSETEVRSQAFFLPSPPDINQDTLPWPLGNKVTDSIPAAINKALLNQAVDNAMHSAFKKKQSLTRSILVIYNGNIIAEQYAPGFDKNTVQLGWSVSKSLTAAMIGILAKEGKLNIDGPAPVPNGKTPQKKKSL